MANSTEIGKIFIDSAQYTVRGQVTSEGWYGYVLFEGLYYLTLPTVSSSQELLTIAEERIKNERSRY